MEKGKESYPIAVVNRAILRTGGIGSFAAISGAQRRRTLAYAAEALRDLYPAEYDDVALLKTSFKLYRVNGNRVDIKRAYAESEEVRRGGQIQREIGLYIRDLLRDHRASQPTHLPLDFEQKEEGGEEQPDMSANNGASPHIVWQAETPAPKLIEVPTERETHRARKTVQDQYRDLAETFRVLPADEIVAYFWDCSVSMLSKARTRLAEEEGFVFFGISLKDSNRQWRVTTRGSEVAAKRAAELSQQGDSLRAKAKDVLLQRIENMSVDDLAKLLAGQ